MHSAGHRADNSAIRLDSPRCALNFFRLPKKSVDLRAFRKAKHLAPASGTEKLFKPACTTKGSFWVSLKMLLRVEQLSWEDQRETCACCTATAAERLWKPRALSTRCPDQLGSSCTCKPFVFIIHERSMARRSVSFTDNQFWTPSERVFAIETKSKSRMHSAGESTSGRSLVSGCSFYRQSLFT